jgi:O-antigen ligase
MTDEPLPASTPTLTRLREQDRSRSVNSTRSAGLGPRAAEDALLLLGRRLLNVGVALAAILNLRGPLLLTIGDWLILAGGACALTAGARPQVSIHPIVVTAAWATALGGAVGALLNDEEGLQSLVALSKLLIAMFAIPWIILSLDRTKGHLLTTTLWWIAGSAVCSSAALLLFLLDVPVLNSSVTNAGRYTGLTGHVSDLGGIASSGAALGLGVLLTPLSPWLRRFAAGALSLCVCGLVLSGSVSGMGALVAAMMYLFLRRGAHLRRLLKIAVAGMLLLTFVQTQQKASGSLTPVDRLLLATGRSGTSADDTAGTRAELAAEAWIQIRERPIFGLGLGSSKLEVIDNFAVHNMYLGIWSGGGILVLLGVAAMLTAAIRSCALRRREDPLFDALIAGSVSAVLFAASAPSVYNRYFWVPVALSIAASNFPLRRRTSQT